MTERQPRDTGAHTVTIMLDSGHPAVVRLMGPSQPGAFPIEITTDISQEKFMDLTGGTREDYLKAMSVSHLADNGKQITTHATTLTTVHDSGVSSTQGHVIIALAEVEGKPFPSSAAILKYAKGWDQLTTDAVHFMLQLHDEWDYPENAYREAMEEVANENGINMESFINGSPEQWATVG